MNIIIKDAIIIACPVGFRDDGSWSKLGAQITHESLKSGQAKSVIYLVEARKVVRNCESIVFLNSVSPLNVFPQLLLNHWLVDRMKKIAAEHGANLKIAPII